MLKVPEHVAEAMRRALDEAETQLKAGVYQAQLAPGQEYPAWVFGGPDAWTLYVEGVPQPSTSGGVPVELTVYASDRRGRNETAESRLVTVPDAPS